MTKLGVLGATALSLSLAIATPALAQQAQGRAGASHAAGAARMGGGHQMGARSNFRGGQANAGRAGFAGRGQGQFAMRGGYRGDRGPNFGRDVGLAAGAAVGTAVAAGDALAFGNYGYADPNYGESYAYNSGYGDSGYANNYAYDAGAGYDDGGPSMVFGQSAEQGSDGVSGDASSCAQRYRSFDPASGTYLGYDGMRHPCM